MLWDIFTIVVSIAAALTFLFVVTRSGAADSRKQSNDFTGAVVAVIGTTYAVILAFMLSGVWTMFQQAEANAEQEANSLVNIWRISEQLQEASGKEVQALCIEYANVMVNQEWPAMQKSEPIPVESREVIDRMWSAAGKTQAHSGSDSIAIYQLLEELRMLTQFRRTRLVQSREGIPKILWCVLVAGGIITVAAACFFGVPSFRFHVLQIVVLSFLISLVLVAIADIDRPYQGDVVVQPSGFQGALDTFQHKSE